MAWRRSGDTGKSSWRNCKGERRPDKNGRPMTKEEMIIEKMELEYAQRTGDLSRIIL